MQTPQRHCEERSDEAIQLCHAKKEAGLLRGACHRARIRATRWLAMTWIRFRDLAAHCVRGLLGNFPPSLLEGRREDRVLAAPAVSCAKCANKNAHEHTGSAETLRPSLRNGFTAYFELSLVNGFLATIAPEKLRFSWT